MKVPRLALMLSIAATLCATSYLSLADPNVVAGRLDGTVIKVIDGDTVDLRAGNKTERIRLAEIDAPESRQPFGVQATKSLSRICLGQAASVVVAQAKRSHGRIVGRLYCAGRDASLEQVASGSAWSYARYVSDPKIPAAEQRAREASLGLWAEANPVPPWAWRRNSK